MDDAAEFGLVMPFIACRSQGGVYDDDSYVAGYELGTVQATLALGGPWSNELPVRTANLHQLDLMAMQNGYTMEVGDDRDGWTFVEFHRNREPT